jgi:hypothetical protein
MCLDGFVIDESANELAAKSGFSGSDVADDHI